jgi:LacI family transcriptional regulator
LTSIRTPIVEIGRAAALQLFARLDDRPTELTESLPFDLVVRRSTGPPPAERRRAGR